MDEREAELFGSIAGILEDGLLLSIVLNAINDLKAMALYDDDVFYVPARRAYNDVLALVEAAAGHVTLPDEFVAALGKTEAYLRRFPQHDELMLDYDIAMDGLQALLQVLMPAVGEVTS